MFTPVLKNTGQRLCIHIDPPKKYPATVTDPETGIMYECTQKPCGADCSHGKGCDAWAQDLHNTGADRPYRRDEILYILTTEDANGTMEQLNDGEPPLTPDEMETVKRGIEGGLGSIWSEVMETAIDGVMDDRKDDRKKAIAQDLKDEREEQTFKNGEQ